MISASSGDLYPFFGNKNTWPATLLATTSSAASHSSRSDRPRSPSLPPLDLSLSLARAPHPLRKTEEQSPASSRLRLRPRPLPSFSPASPSPPIASSSPAAIFAGRPHHRLAPLSLLRPCPSSASSLFPAVDSEQLRRSSSPSAPNLLPRPWPPPRRLCVRPCSRAPPRPRDSSTKQPAVPRRSPDRPFPRPSPARSEV